MSYKPVIYTFAVLGLVGTVAVGGAVVTAFRSASRTMMDPAGSMLNIDERPFGEDFQLEDDYGSYDNATDSRMMFDPSATSSDAFPGAMLDDADRPQDDSYLGTDVLYSTLRDKNVMMALKLPDTIDQELRTVLQRPDTSLEELYQSNKRLALKLTTLDGERETIIVQNLENGVIYSTGINAHANYVVNGSKIVHLTTNGTARPNELQIVNVYDIETNRTQAQKPLAPEFSYTKKVTPAGAVGDLQVKAGKVEVKVYSSSGEPRFDRDRAVVRTETI